MSLRPFAYGAAILAVAVAAAYFGFWALFLGYLLTSTEPSFLSRCLREAPRGTAASLAVGFGGTSLVALMLGALPLLALRRRARPLVVVLVLVVLITSLVVLGGIDQPACDDFYFTEDAEGPITAAPLVGLPIYAVVAGGALWASRTLWRNPQRRRADPASGARS